MNIIVQDYGGAVGCRPDTTWERENKDLFSPDFVVAYRYAPVLFARIGKAGKCVGAKFATRYYDAFGYGLLLYPETPDGTLLTIMDHTSFLPSPLYGRAVLANGGNLFELRLDGKLLYSTSCGTESIIEEAIVRATQYLYIRIGDLVAVELIPVTPLQPPSLSVPSVPSVSSGPSGLSVPSVPSVPSGPSVPSDPDFVPDPYIQGRNPNLHESRSDIQGGEAGLLGHRISATYCGNWLLDFLIR